MAMLSTAELDMANSVNESDIADFLIMGIKGHKGKDTHIQQKTTVL
jgi:hypothetical protein